MEEGALGDQVRVLAGNAAALWNGGAEVLDLIVKAAPTQASAPVAAINALGSEGLKALFSDPDSRAGVTIAYNAFLQYLKQSTWFERCVKTDRRLKALRGAPVAYFCAEFAVASWLPIYSGGLGVLAGDMLKEASDMGIPFVGVGLFYRHGFFHQKLDGRRYQTQVYDDLDPEQLGLERAVDTQGNAVTVQVPIADRMVHAAVWKFLVGRVTLYLLDTDIPENGRDEDRAITSGLYTGGVETRIQQELVLGIGGVRALHALGISPSIYSMNEGHAAFLGVELLADVLHGTTFDSALTETRKRIVYTNHTVVPAGNDIFPRHLIQAYLGPYADERGIGAQRLLDLASSHPESGFSMAVLAFQMSGKANAVSRLHAQVIPREWPGFPVEAVTNGVHVPTWLGREMQDLFAKYDIQWRADHPRWEAIRAIPDAELMAAHNRQRRRMIEYVNAVSGTNLSPDALTLVWARRFAEYKRAFLIASDRERLIRLLSSSARPVQLVISGKAHPADEGAKDILRGLLQELESEPAFAGRVAFVEDYSIDVSRPLAAGADIWLNTPRKPLEASGTSGMKSSDNGGLQVTVTDGWAAEVDWWGVGWGIAGVDDETDRNELYAFLENGVVPAFYDRNSAGVSARWVSMMKNTMITTLSGYSSRRMLLDYIHRLYLPLVELQGVIPAGTAT